MDAGGAFDRDFALGTSSSEQSALYEVEQAINRIRNGTFLEIHLGNRLNPSGSKPCPGRGFLPTEKELEEEGNARRARLAPLENVVARMSADEERDAEKKKKADAADLCRFRTHTGSPSPSGATIRKIGRGRSCGDVRRCRVARGKVVLQ